MCSARFPSVVLSAPHYESFYLKACHPAGGLGVWIRYTVHKRAGDAPKGFVWFTLFDATAGVLASKVEYPNPVAGESRYIAMDGCEFSPGHVIGSAASAQLDAAWDLRFTGEAAPLWHLPRWAYDAPVPRTKLLSPHPHVVFAGWLRAGARQIDVDGWPGMVGHNWGSEHARRAIWIEGTNFSGHEQAWLDIAFGRIGVGPFTAPWIGNGVLCLDGRRHRLGGLERIARTHVEERRERCRFRLRGEGITVRGEVGARTEDFVGWIYAQPKGGERQTINCSIADLRLEVNRAGMGPTRLEVTGGAAYELQMEERYHAIPVQPFPDG